MQYVGQHARCVPAARVAVFGCIVECLAHRCDQGFAHLAEAFDLLLRRRERELAPLASVPLDFTRPSAEAGGDVVDDPHRVAATRQVAQAIDGYPYGVGSNALDRLWESGTRWARSASRAHRARERTVAASAPAPPVAPAAADSRSDRAARPPRGAACCPPVAERWC